MSVFLLKCLDQWWGIVGQVNRQLCVLWWPPSALRRKSKLPDKAWEALDGGCVSLQNQASGNLRWSEVRTSGGEAGVRQGRLVEAGKGRVGAFVEL